MKAVSVLIKPVSGQCNVECRYCFYKSIASKRVLKNQNVMKSFTVDRLIEEVFKYSNGGPILFAFQGGEPTLAGLEFFEYFIEQVKKKNEHQIISYSIQTNGVELDNAWCQFFKKHDFLVGISLDGIAKTHNHYRTHQKDEGTFRVVVESIERLKRYNVEYHILTVITDMIVNSIDEIYNYYKEMSIEKIQFIPCIPTRNIELTNDNYFIFLQRLFDLWFEDVLDDKYIQINIFDEIMSKYSINRQLNCYEKGLCVNQLVIESNGDVYPCDFYAEDQHALGNIKSISIKELFEHPKSVNFVDNKSMNNESCLDCSYYSICRNGCKRFRDDDNRYIYCKAIKDFLLESENRLRLIIKYKSR